MNLLWIIIAIVVVLLIIVGIVVVVGNNRKKSKTVSFKKNEEQPKELTQQEKSGNYQAKGGFNFAPANAPEKQPEPVQPRRVDKPTETVAPAEKEPEFELTHDAAEAVEELNDDEAPKVDEEQEQQDAPLFQDLAEEHAEDPDNDVDVEKRVEQFEATEAETPTPEEEAQEAADIAQVTAEVADQAREQTPAPEGEPAPAQEPLDDIEPVAGRIGRLRGRLSRSQNAIGQGLLGILTAGDLDEDAWEEIEDTLIMADLGADLTMRVTDQLREKIAERGVGSEDEARAMLRETLVEAGRPEMDRSIKAMPVDGKPAVILVVGVNGTGKTTTTGKLGRVLVSMGHRVLFGAADTFRAAAADQLETWGRRVGAITVRGKEGADPAAVAFDAVARGVQEQADVVVIDTAGRLHTSTGLMDQLGKVKRVVEKKSQVDEVLLVLDATVGQNGLTQARIFRDVVDITGVVLTKLDGTAKGGIVFQVQEELGVPVKLVGLGEGADDLAPFEVEGFVDALLG
ncbi:Signal recognition particle receptor FtsY [Corynebacterium cystitidis DSM 20524]|uniref:Signal recognition particle receptor FtsY n=2 Tax=Corynebacterium cystitidis TaxID=35757 RepID=A0A1H9NXY0_9CORY|nr:Signal recognition particle receptor FtsY [Corynebacterium cystitidis DSM 20524]SER40193.1 signal recognition particle-docking protein FtsY [Corynebacterium cystitidis DSM 20524]SNV71567.1 signal recognition particle-docking protein FtsY [Corynebacterium cystitidis]